MSLSKVNRPVQSTGFFMRENDYSIRKSHE